MKCFTGNCSDTFLFLDTGNATAGDSNEFIFLTYFAVIFSFFLLFSRPPRRKKVDTHHFGSQFITLCMYLD